MRRAWCAGVMAALLSPGLVVAQQPASGAQGSATSQGAAATPAGSVTITGCVERADQLMSGGANTLATSIDSLDFVLIRARQAGAEPSAAVGTSGSSGAAAGASATAAAKPEERVGPMFRLDGETAMINPHVGHQVEIVGTRSSGPSSAPDARANATTPTLATAPTVRVESIKMIAETCPR